MEMNGSQGVFAVFALGVAALLFGGCSDDDGLKCGRYEVVGEWVVYHAKTHDQHMIALKTGGEPYQMDNGYDFGGVKVGDTVKAGCGDGK